MADECVTTGPLTELQREQNSELIEQRLRDLARAREVEKGAEQASCETVSESEHTIQEETMSISPEPASRQMKHRR